VRFLLDTHVFLWAITDNPKLSEQHRALYESPTSELFLSIASLWEVTIKVGLGKLALPRPAAAYLTRQMDKNQVRLLPIQPAHLNELENLPPLHRDPFDRLLAAQARVEKMPILTGDKAVSELTPAHLTR